MDLNPPASRSELARLASVLGAPVPQDLEEFYLGADGMRDPEMDRWHVNFWSIERVIREKDIVRHNERDWWAFADVLMYSWVFRISPEGTRTSKSSNPCSRSS